MANDKPTKYTPPAKFKGFAPVVAPLNKGENAKRMSNLTGKKK